MASARVGPSPGSRLRVLLIEDNPADARLIESTLSRALPQGFDIELTGRLGDAEGLLAEQQFDVVLLDLQLPDSRGLDTLAALRRSAPALPIVVLTVLGDQETALAAVRMGAQDYLPKEIVDPELLGRAIRYSIERQVLMNRIEDRGSETRRRFEVELVERLQGSGSATTVPRLVGEESLNISSPTIFQELLRRYRAVLHRVVPGEENQGLDLTHVGELEVIAEHLGALKAGPADAVALHRAALESDELAENAAHRADLAQQGREVLFHLLSLLVNYYRGYSLLDASTGNGHG